MWCTLYPFGLLGAYRYVTILSLREGRMLLSRRADRATWETQGGHIEPGETPEQAARRELYEESGALDFTLRPLCDYRAGDGADIANGSVFAAEIQRLGPLPAAFEMAETAWFDTLPDGLTYPDICPQLFGWLAAAQSAPGIRLVNRERILPNPPPTPSCHASTLARNTDGSIAAAWFGGTREGAEDVAIWSSVRTQTGWSAPAKLIALPETPHWNPVLFRCADGSLRLFWKASQIISDWTTYTAVSQDGGRSWSAPQPLVPGDDSGGRGPVKNKPIRLADGGLLAPASHERDGWRPFVDRSEDEGVSWTRSAYISAPSYEGRPVGLIQPTLWESRPGAVHMLLRSDAGLVYRSDSSDGGRSWCEAYPTALPNNNSGLDLVRLPDGRLLLAANPVGENWGARTPLALLVSEDNGYSWDTALLLEDRPGEYSYPAIVYEQGRVFLTYTWNRTDIAFCVLEFGR